MAKFCTSCGAKNEDDSVFCEACGSNISAPRAPVTLAAKPVAPSPPSHIATFATEPAAGGAASVAGKGAAIIGFVEGILRYLLNTGVYVFTYVALMLPTYALPYFGSNSAIVGGLSAAAGLGSFPTWWIHMMFLWGLLVISWFRGRIIGKTWLWVLPFLAALFDMMPGMNLIPLVPTGMHVAAIIVGARSAAMSGNASGAGGGLNVGAMRILVALGGFALLLMGLLSSIATYDGKGRTSTAPNVARPLSSANTAPVATERHAATPANPGIKPAASGAAPTTVARAAPSSSGPHPNWHGTWQGATPNSRMVITAAGVEIFDVYEYDGKKDKFHKKLPWVTTSEPNGNDEESGYAKSSVSLAEVSRAYESTVALFKRDPSDLSISDPTLSRRLIDQIKPGNYRVVWAYLGGDCGLRDMILDGDLILSIVNCRYRHQVSLFTRQGATPPAVGQEPQGTARVTAAPSLSSGRWQGTVTQAGYAPYPAVMQLQSTSAGIPGGTMAYPSMPCTALLTFMRAEGNAFWFRESIQEGRGKCLDGGQISVSATSGDTVVWRWFVGENVNSPAATGTFRR